MTPARGFSLLALLPVTLALSMALLGTLAQTDRLIHAGQWYAQAHRAQELALHVARSIDRATTAGNCDTPTGTFDGFEVTVLCHRQGDRVVSVQVRVQARLPGLDHTLIRTARH